MTEIASPPSSIIELTPQILFERYKESFSPLVSLFERKVGQTAFALADVARIITYFSIDLVPKLMSDVGKLSSLAGSQKKDLVIDSVKFILSQIFLQLDDTNGDLPVYLEEAILIGVNPTIEVLLQVEGDKLVFNAKTKNCLQRFITCCSFCKKN